MENTDKKSRCNRYAHALVGLAIVSGLCLSIIHYLPNVGYGVGIAGQLMESTK